MLQMIVIDEEVTTQEQESILNGSNENTSPV